MSTFAERASELTQGVMVGVAMSLAKEVGIFQALVDADSPLTSHQVALAGGLKERSGAYHAFSYSNLERKKKL